MVVAIVVRLVWRRSPAVAEVQRVWAREGLWWVVPVCVSAQALTKRLDVLPAAIMGDLFTEGWARLQAQAPSALPHARWGPVRAHCPLITLVDGSTLQALRKQTQGLQQCEDLVLGGTMIWCSVVSFLVECGGKNVLYSSYPAIGLRYVTVAA